MQGSFDSLKATFTLKRRTTYFIFQLYIPSGFLVFLSWLSFWVDRQAIPARISLVITCILSTMFLFESTNSSLPQISYLKAVDYYLITSFWFIVSCMVEFVCVLNFPDKSTSALLKSQSLVPVSVDFKYLEEIGLKNKYGMRLLETLRVHPQGKPSKSRIIGKHHSGKRDVRGRL